MQVNNLHTAFKKNVEINLIFISVLSYSAGTRVTLYKNEQSKL